MSARVMLSFPPDFLAAVDTLAAAEHRSRSDLVREALRRYMQIAEIRRLRPRGSDRLATEEARLGDEAFSAAPEELERIFGRTNGPA